MIYNAKSDINGTISPFNYRKKITINHSGALNAYQAKLTIDHVNTNMKTDFGDIRFNTDTGNYIPYWIETKVNDTSADVWIKADLVDGNTITYMYYGNSGLTSESNMSGMFIREISGIVGAWDLNGDALDRSGYEHNGTLYGNTTYTTGRFGQAATFDGTTDYINIAGITPMPTTGSLSFWAYMTNWADGSYRTIFDTNAGNGDNRILIRKENVNIILFYIVGTAEPSAQVNGASVSGSGWKHVVITWTANSVKGYLNGVLQGEDTTFTMPTFPSLNAFIGATPNAGAYSFNGLIEHGRHYNIVLSQSEVTDQYNNNGYVTTNYVGKELIRKYTATEPTVTTSSEQTITAKSMSIVPRESPCRVGICIVDANITWTNTGETVTFTPSIIFDSNTTSLAPISLPSGDTIITFAMSGLSAGNHTICPDPN